MKTRIERFFINKKATLLIEGKSSPLFIVNAYQDDISPLISALENLHASFLVINRLRWDDDLTPWPVPPIYPSDPGSKGEAAAFSTFLNDEALPWAISEGGLLPAHLGIAGYSLGGLFALWEGIRRGGYAAIVSASGSLWYPDFLEFLSASEKPPSLMCTYFSLGNQEANTCNKTLRSVGEKTLAARELLEQKGVRTVFVSEKGNHFVDGEGRLARGIAWALQNVEK